MENIEIRVIRLISGSYRIDSHKIGADETVIEARASNYSAALKAGQRIAAMKRATGEFKYVRLMVEELF